MATNVLAWVGFVAVVLVLLAVDLGVFNRKAHVISMREAARWAGITVVLAGIFASLIWTHNLPTGIVGGSQHALEFITGYLIELALSVDNIFVFVLIFNYFAVPSKYQHRVLFWGVLGALVFRGVMIGAGSVLLQRFEWIIYVFGAFLVFTGIRMAMQDDVEIHPESNPALKLVRRFLPVSRDYDGQHFFTMETVGGRLRRVATPLFVVLVLVETTDLIFAVDSIPAIFAVTRDPFIVFTSNVFAILCLRSLYFLLAGIIDRFHYLKLGLSVVLVFIGGKMLATIFHLHMDTLVSLLVVAGVLLSSVVLSLLRPAPDTVADPTDIPAPDETGPAGSPPPDDVPTLPAAVAPTPAADDAPRRAQGG